MRWLLVLGVLMTTVLLGTYIATAAMKVPPPATLVKLETTAPSRQGDLFPARTVAAGEPSPLRTTDRTLPAEVPWKGGRITVSRFLTTTRTNALVVLQDGALAYEWYRDGVTAGTRMSSWSVAKSLVSLLIGQAIGRGELSEDDRLVDLVPSLSAGGEYDAITVRDLLDMTAGVDVPENYNEYWPFTGTARLFLTTDLPGFVRAHRRVTFAPGSEGSYLSVNTELLGMILEEVTRKPLSTLLSEGIWKPVGAERSATWNLDRKGGIEKAFCCVNATARDFARVGQLLVDDGRVGDRQVVPESWITRILAPAEHPVDDWGYSAQWWHPAPGPDLSAIGIYGQYVYADPATRTVIVKLSDYGTEQDELETFLALRSLAEGIG